MTGWAIVRRVVAILLLVVWASQVLGVAVFAVPSRFDGVESVFLARIPTPRRGRRRVVVGGAAAGHV